MSKPHEDGSVTTMVVIILLVFGLFGSLVFGFWAFNGRSDYKNNSDKKSAQTVAVALANQKIDLQKQFDEQSKLPLKTFQGSSTYGTVSFSYPRTWSGYVDQSSTTEPINGYFYPDIVPGFQAGTAYALRVELLTTDYDQVVKQLAAQIKTKGLSASAFLPPKLTGIKNAQPGTLFVGTITQTLSGEMLVIKVRDKTLQISAQSKDFTKDFTDTVLPSLTFVP